MQIERINKGSWGKLRAFFDIRTDEGLVVKGFKIVEGSNGPFIGMPSQKNNDGEYFDTVYADQDLKGKITELAMAAYGSDIMDDGMPASATQGQAVSEPPPFSDDDIPF